MTSISASQPVSVPQKTAQPSYILLPDEAIAKLSPEEQAMVKNMQEGMQRARAFAQSDQSKVNWTKGRSTATLTPEQKIQLYRPKNNGGGNFSFLKPTKFESNAANFPNIKGIPADELDDRIRSFATSIKKGEFKGMSFHSANGDQLTSSPEEYLGWLKAAKASVVSFEGFA